LNPIVQYVLAQDMKWRMVTREHVEVRVSGDTVTLPLPWYLVLLQFSQPSTVDRACAACSIDLGEHPELGRALMQLRQAGILLRRDEATRSATQDQSIVDLLAPGIFAKPANRKQVATALRAGGLVVIPNAFRKRVADEVHQALTQTAEWGIYESFYPGFFFHHHNLYDPWVWPPAMRRMQSVFASSGTRSFIADLTERDCSAEPTFSASLYLPGDHSLPHNDLLENRSVAYVWHLTKNWSSSWGGAFYWVPSGASLMPEFNSLLLFVVSDASNHFVTTVSPHARQQRLAVNGWWRSGLTKSKPSAKKPGRVRPGPICSGRVVVV